MSASMASPIATRRSAVLPSFGVGMRPRSITTGGSREASRIAKPIPVVPGSMPRMMPPVIGKRDGGGGSHRRRLEDFLWDVEVRVHLLDVVELLERVHEPQQGLRGVGID